MDKRFHDKDGNIVWIASYPKSGNTWLRLLISAHYTGVCDINNMVGAYGEDADYWINRVAPRPFSELTLMARTILRPAALMHMQEALPFTPICVKTHNINEDIDGYPLIPPHLTRGAVYMVRDPRDVCISYSEHMGMSIDDAIDRMSRTTTALTPNPDAEPNSILRRWDTHVQSWAGEHDYPVAILRYEDLKDNTEVMFGKVVQALGWDHNNKEKIRKAVEATEFAKLQKQEEEKGFTEASDKTERFFKRGKAGGWREILTEEQIAKIESEFHETMIELDYELATRAAA